MPGEKRSALFRGGDRLGFDPRLALRTLRGADPKLGLVIERLGPFGLQVNELHNPFSSLLEAIVYQQLTGKAAETILNRVRTRFRPRRYPSPRDILDCPEEDLRADGLSRAKVAAVRDLAAKTLDGTVPTLARLRRLSDEEILERLTGVRGIGRWTVEMMLIFRLGRPDVLPVTDYGIRKGFMRAFRTRELPSPKRIAEHGEAWRPYRTVASWYLWRAVDGPYEFNRKKTKA